MSETMNETTTDMLREHINNLHDRLVELFEAIDNDHPYAEALPEGYEWDGSALIGPDGETVDDLEGTLPDIEWYDPDDYLTEAPLEVVDERGRQFAVVFSTGGPHIEVAADGNGWANFEGYWAGDRWTRGGEIADRALDYFIHRDV